MFVRRTSTVLAGAILLAVAGCGGTDSNSKGAADPAAADSTAPTAPPSSLTVKSVPAT
jgi:hypothetical protein